MRWRYEKKMFERVEFQIVFMSRESQKKKKKMKVKIYISLPFI